ncbi:magnesium transporter MRS2-I-like [Vicia villosa]|uniref:magnesium transporter MRS2-I-like n=1 Tax=Vicia villosa TaxID=3911 RepID=UPI00273CA0EB|nr:magnesium transporter MRS2-I-like [Vicia villosa]
MAQESSIDVTADSDPQAMVVTKMKTSWILFDARNQGLILDVDKHAIMHRVEINAHDLRILDPFLSYPSTILVREKAILLNLEHIKAIITAKEVLLRDPTDEPVVPVVDKLKRRLPTISAIHHEIDSAEEDESPFEFRALEVALEAICSFLAERTTELEMDAYSELDELTCKISGLNLDRVRKLINAMTKLTAGVQKIRDELEKLLQDDDKMADLYLSRKAGSASPISGSDAASQTIESNMSRASMVAISLYENGVDEVEMLLEAYFMQIDATLNKLITLREYIDDTQDYINIQLDNHRNQLIRLELFLSAGTACLTSYSVVAGIFGMNIPYTWNDDHSYMFKWVIIFGGIFSAFLFLMITLFGLKKGLLKT